MKYFVLTNDPDHGLAEDYRPILKKLAENGIFITTAVFCVLKDDGSELARHCYRDETHCLQDKEYRKLMLEALGMGHEIAFHGYSQVSDTRDEFKRGLEIFKKTFGDYPKIYIEHGGHPEKHSIGMCKKENLSVSGYDQKSKYYVADTIKETFDLVWTHDYLLDYHKKPLPLKDIFIEKDGITYFNRSRMYHFNEIKKYLNETNNIIIGYTHFGYRGYKSRWFWQNFLDANSYYERWLGGDLNKAIKLIKRFAKEQDVKSITLHELFQKYQQEIKR